MSLVDEAVALSDKLLELIDRNPGQPQFRFDHLDSRQMPDQRVSVLVGKIIFLLQKLFKATRRSYRRMNFGVS